MCADLWWQVTGNVNACSTIYFYTSYGYWGRLKNWFTLFFSVTIFSYCTNPTANRDVRLKGIALINTTGDVSLGIGARWVAPLWIHVYSANLHGITEFKKINWEGQSGHRNISSLKIFATAVAFFHSFHYLTNYLQRSRVFPMKIDLL